MTEAAGAILSELELDALTELVNIGVSSAAASLREMVGEQIFLSVPNLALFGREQAIAVLSESGQRRLVAVHQVFDGEITGRVMLIFHEANSLELVRAVTGGELSLEDIVELEQEALAETGNIVLNGCLGTMANILQRSLKVSLPEVVRGEGAALFNMAPPPEAGDIILFLYINFMLKSRDINGYIAMLMDISSLEALAKLLREFIQRTSEDDDRS